MKSLMSRAVTESKSQTNPFIRVLCRHPFQESFHNAQVP